jgi:hypothetical protein
MQLLPQDKEIKVQASTDLADARKNIEISIIISMQYFVAISI